MPAMFVTDNVNNRCEWLSSHMDFVCEFMFTDASSTLSSLFALNHCFFNSPCCNQHGHVNTANHQSEKTNHDMETNTLVLCA